MLGAMLGCDAGVRCSGAPWGAMMFLPGAFLKYTLKKYSIFYKSGNPEMTGYLKIPVTKITNQYFHFLQDYI